MNTSLSAMIYFARVQLLAAPRNLNSILITQVTPIGILLLFWLVGGDSSEGQETVKLMFPAIVGMTIFMGASTQAVRVLTWRRQGVFRRFAATPTPVGYVVLGDALAQVALGLIQALLTLLFGTLVLGIAIEPSGLALGLLVLILASACFTGYGLIMATITRRPETASLATIFTLLPMFFIGGGMGPMAFSPFVETLGRWLPVGAMNNLLIPLLATGQIPEQAGWLLLALVGYTVLFMAVVIAFFRWE
jgi:ABC-2 type transport system permease protein